MTGATGTVGRQVVSQLLERHVDVQAATRDPDAADLPSEVDVVRVDLAEPDELERNLAGVSAVFLIWPFTSAERTQKLAPRVVDVIARHAERIVYLSATPAADRPESFWARVEQAIVRTDLEWTFLRPTGFAANTRIWADQIRGGDVVRWPYGEAGRSLIHERDIAAVAVKALTEDGHAGAAYHLSGPETLTQAVQVRLIGEAIGRPLGWQELPRDEALKQLATAFGDRAFAETALDAWAAFVDRPEPTTPIFEEVTGRPARSFREWATDHAAGFR